MGSLAKKVFRTSIPVLLTFETGKIGQTYLVGIISAIWSRFLSSFTTIGLRLQKDPFRIFDKFTTV
jgi:hypothetical protein